MPVTPDPRPVSRPWPHLRPHPRRRAGAGRLRCAALLAGLLAGSFVANAQPAAPPGAPLACGAPAELLEAGGASLPATARAVREGRLRILIAGSASVFGPGTSGPDSAWPARLQALLERRFPNLALEMTLRGGRGLAAAGSAALIAEELPRVKPDLVIWQTGTVDAVRGIELDQVTDTLNTTADKVAAAGADLVMMDPQFSRFLRANTNIDPYREAIRLVAAAHNAPLLRRYELMKFWAETDRVDLERASRDMRPIVADRLNACLAEALAVVVRNAVAEARGRAGGPRP